MPNVMQSLSYNLKITITFFQKTKLVWNVLFFLTLNFHFFPKEKFLSHNMAHENFVPLTVKEVPTSYLNKVNPNTKNNFYVLDLNKGQQYKDPDKPSSVILNSKTIDAKRRQSNCLQEKRKFSSPKNH